MYKVIDSAKVPNAPKLSIEELKVELDKRIEFFRDYTEEEFTHEVEANSVRFNEDDAELVEVWAENFE